MDRISVAILGATGAVGQRFIQLLDDHPWFDLKLLTASEKSSGEKYKDAASWGLVEKMPEYVKNKTILPIDPDILKNESVELLFSALPSNIAQNIESDLALKGFKIFSNASSHRMVENVPLLIADINPEHISLVEGQKKSNISHGFIVTNPNCSVTGLATALKPLEVKFGISQVTLSTYQALSGAGYPGVPSMDIQGNVLPFIPGEEEKVEMECKKILGNLMEKKIDPLNVHVIANCARVPVRDGHLEAVVVELEERVTMDRINDVFKNFNIISEKGLKLPSAPDKPIIVTEEENRPQPIQDINAGYPKRARGMAITIGRIKIIDQKLRFFLLVHNTIRGAAGCSIMNAELAKVDGYL